MTFWEVSMKLNTSSSIAVISTKRITLEVLLRGLMNWLRLRKSMALILRSMISSMYLYWLITIPKGLQCQVESEAEFT